MLLPPDVHVSLHRDHPGGTIHPCFVYVCYEEADFRLLHLVHPLTLSLMFAG